MSKIVRKYSLGCIAKTFEPKDIADMLNRITPTQIKEMRIASKQAARELNAENEMKKLVSLLTKLN